MGKMLNCPKCNSEYTYEDRSLFVCPECGNEWTLELESENIEAEKVYKDSNGNILNEGDSFWRYDAKIHHNKPENSLECFHFLCKGIKCIPFMNLIFQHP